MTDITIRGKAAEQVLQNISIYPELFKEVNDSKALWTNNVDAIDPYTRAMAATFCQLIAFGSVIKDLGVSPKDKRNRNEKLADHNLDIFALVLEDEPQKLIINGEKQQVVITSGHLSGLVVVYPLNKSGDAGWRSNSIGPQRFSSKHLVPHSSFRPASSAFLGAAIDFRSIQDILSTPKLDFQPDKPPKRLMRVLTKATLRCLPKVIDVVEGKAGPKLVTESNTAAPAIFTSFSGKGSGEMLAQQVGFLREPRVEKERGDRRYAVDLKQLESLSTSNANRCKLLNAWAWFEGTADPENSKSLVVAIVDAALKLQLKENAKNEEAQ